MIDHVDARDVELAHELATVASLAALPFAGGAVGHRFKSDGTPVSDADLAAEEAMLALLARHRPCDGVISEERGTIGAGERRWVLDPIDGTAQFVAGREEWGTHVALEVDGEIVLGIITRPIQQRRWWAARGHGAFVASDRDPVARSKPLAMSETTSIGGARVGLYRSEHTRLADLLAARGIRVVPHGPSHILDLVEGRLDGIVSERCGFLCDHAPAVVLTVESGGSFTDPHGGVRADLRGGIYSNAALHDDLHRILVDGSVDLAGSVA